MFLPLQWTHPLSLPLALSLSVLKTFSRWLRIFVCMMMNNGMAGLFTCLAEHMGVQCLKSVVHSETEEPMWRWIFICKHDHRREAGDQRKIPSYNIGTDCGGNQDRHGVCVCGCLAVEIVYWPSQLKVGHGVASLFPLEWVTNQRVALDKLSMSLMLHYPQFLNRGQCIDCFLYNVFVQFCWWILL